MSISAVREVPPVVVAAPTDKTNFTGEGGEGNKGTGLFLPLLAGLGAGTTTYLLGSKQSAEGLMKLEGQGLTDTFTKLGEKAGKITDATKKADAEGAITTVKTALETIKNAAKDNVESVKTAAKTTIEGALEKLPKLPSLGKAAIWGGVALVGTYILAKIFGGSKEA